MAVGRVARGSAFAIAGLLLGGSLASAKELVRKGKPVVASIEVSARLVEHEEHHFWCTYEPGATIHGQGTSPRARFEVTSPPRYAGRSFAVLFMCAERKDLLPALRSGTGSSFLLVLPQDFLDGKYTEIDDCSVASAAMKRWQPLRANPKASVINPDAGAVPDGAAHPLARP